MTFRRKFAAKAAPFADTPKREESAYEPLGRRNVGHSIPDSIRELAQTFARAFDPYRPELHYMRGPGPKWHAKRAAFAAEASRPANVHVPTEVAAARA
jgi:hypothetical protein